MLTCGLDSSLDLDATTIDLHVGLGLESLGDLSSRDGTEEDALFADASFNLDGQSIESRLGSIGLGDAVLFTSGDVVLALLELLQVALGSRDSDLVRVEVVVGETGSDIHDVAFTTLALEFTQKDNFHFILL